MKQANTKYIWIPIIISLILIPIGFYFVDWNKSGDGAGLYSRDWSPKAIFAYWNPDDFYQPPKSVPAGAWYGLLL